MANQSQKKNSQSIRTLALVLTWATYGLIGWVMIFNSFYLTAQQVSIWHWLLCLSVCAASYFCFKQIMKCWQLQLPSEAAQYYYDIFALNSLVQLIDPFTHQIWHAYWLIVVCVGYKVLRWLWDYITPKYDQPQEEESAADLKRKQKKERKEKIKYIKK